MVALEPPHANLELALSYRETCSGPPRWEEIDWCIAKLGPIRYERRKDLIKKHWLTTSPLRWRKLLANLVLQDTIERIYAGRLYADVPRGIFLVRGENVLLLGEVVCGRNTRNLHMDRELHRSEYPC
jgi:hypothetical protein